MHDQEIKAISKELQRCGGGVFVVSPFAPFVDCLIRRCEKRQRD